jgi:hypothetical protein
MGAKQERLHSKYFDRLAEFEDSNAELGLFSAIGTLVEPGDSLLCSSTGLSGWLRMRFSRTPRWHEGRHAATGRADGEHGEARLIYSAEGTGGW